MDRYVDTQACKYIPRYIDLLQNVHSHTSILCVIMLSKILTRGKGLLQKPLPRSSLLSLIVDHIPPGMVDPSPSPPCPQRRRLSLSAIFSNGRRGKVFESTPTHMGRSAVAKRREKKKTEARSEEKRGGKGRGRRPRKRKGKKNKTEQRCFG